MAKHAVCLTTTKTHQTTPLARADIPAPNLIHYQKTRAKMKRKKNLACYPHRTRPALETELTNVVQTTCALKPRTTFPKTTQKKTRAWSHTHTLTHTQKKKPTRNHGLAHIHPSGHQPTNYHAKQLLSQHTVTATNQPPTARPKRIKPQPNHPASTQPTAKQFEISLHTTNPTTPNTPPTNEVATNQTKWSVQKPRTANNSQ